MNSFSVERSNQYVLAHRGNWVLLLVCSRANSHTDRTKRTSELNSVHCSQFFPRLLHLSLSTLASFVSFIITKRAFNFIWIYENISINLLKRCIYLWYCIVIIQISWNCNWLRSLLDVCARSKIKLWTNFYSWFSFNSHIAIRRHSHLDSTKCNWIVAY